MRLRINKIISVIIIFFSFILTVESCGKKGMPVPPKRIEPPSVTNLRASLKGDIVSLSWSIPEMNEKKASDLKEFIIYHSQKALPEEKCNTCPILFQRIAKIPIEDGKIKFIDGNMQIIYALKLKKGYGNIYKVVLVSKDGLLSKESNLVNVNF